MTKQSQYSGPLKKMAVTLAEPVQYQLIVGEDQLLLNDYLGQRIQLEYLGKIHCIQCGRDTKKSFFNGHCFPCMQRINECGNCMITPERCKIESHGCPEDDWAHAQCHAEQIVYLANSSSLKVGITRVTHTPMRWIDQGAIQAIPIIQVKNRYQSGLVEVALKNHVSDKTNWRKMLKNETEHMDLLSESKALLDLAVEEIKQVQDKYIETGDITILENQQPVDITYPVIAYPEKVTSLSFDKQPLISGVLMGIKGQYLILDTGVLNIRKFGGYHVAFTHD